MASNRVIGLNNQMPWHLSADLKRFKKVTLGFPILMGRSTYEAIGKPLPDRLNIIISRNVDYYAPGCLVFNDPDVALKHACSLAEEVFIIGGATLYQLFLPYSDYLYITKIKKEFLGDTLFPEWRTNEWIEIEREDITNDIDAGFDYCFLKYVRGAPKN